MLEDKQLQEVEKMNCELMKKLQEQETSILFSSGTLTGSILFSSGTLPGLCSLSELLQVMEWSVFTLH